MKIKDVENKIGLTKANIRYYEKEGLLSPSRNHENNYRDYKSEDIQCLERIKVLRALGISIAEIKQLNTGDLLLAEAVKNRLQQIYEEEQTLLKIQSVCEFIMENHISFSNVDETLLSSAGESKNNWKTEFHKIWKEDIIQEKITKTQLNNSLIFIVSSAYLVNIVVSVLFGNYFLRCSDYTVIVWFFLSAGIGCLSYLTVLFTADIRIHTAAFLVSALTLTPFIVCIYFFIQRIPEFSVIPTGNINRFQLVLFWALMLIYAGILFCLIKKYDAGLRDRHIIGIAGIYAGIGTILSELLCGRWTTPAVLALFLIFTLYIGLSWNNIIKEADDVNRYYAVTAAGRIVNICGVIFNISGITNAIGYVRR